MNGLIRHPDVQRFFVSIGVHRDCLDTKFLTRADDTTCDFAPIGDEYLGEHGVSLAGRADPLPV